MVIFIIPLILLQIEVFTGVCSHISHEGSIYQFTGCQNTSILPSETNKQFQFTSLGTSELHNRKKRHTKMKLSEYHGSWNPEDQDAPWKPFVIPFGPIPLNQEVGLHKLSPETQVERTEHSLQANSNSSSLAAVVEGFGPYLCILRVSTEQDSGVPSVFVRDVGFYRCYFQGGARKIMLSTFGSGFYQCFFQRPGIQLSVRQGVGQFFCFFQGIRYFKGFLPPPKGPKVKKNFVEFLGSINYDLIGENPQDPQGHFKLLGIYNFGPEGSGLNFGLLQLTEAFDGRLKNQTKELIEVDMGSLEKTSRMGVNQLGQWQYHFKGTDFDHGRSDRFNSFLYNFVNGIDDHRFTFLVARYEFGGQGEDPFDDREFVQVWGIYNYAITEREWAGLLGGSFQAILVGQYDFRSYFLPLDPGGLDHVQLILQYNQGFEGFRTTDTGSLALTWIHQANNYVDEDFFDPTDYVIAIGQLRYAFLDLVRAVNGFVQFSVIYQRFLEGPEIRRPPGYLQLVGQYSRRYDAPLGLTGHQATWLIQGIAEYVFPEEELSNGFAKFQWQYVVDTTDWFIGQKSSFVTFLGLYQCIWFGFRMPKSFCYFQLYLFYKGAFNGKGLSSGQTTLLCQYYQEVSTL